MKVKVPYARAELVRLATAAGLTRPQVLGNRSLGYDVLDYAKGFVSATLDVLLASFRKGVRRVRTRRQGAAGNPAIPGSHLSQLVEACVAATRGSVTTRKLHARGKDHLGAVLLLIGGPPQQNRAFRPLRVVP